MIKTNVYLPYNQRRRLKKISQKTGLTMSELIRRAIDEFLSGAGLLRKRGKTND